MCVYVCVSSRNAASLFTPLWQLADVQVTVSDSVWVCLRDYEKLPAFSAVWDQCEATVRMLCGDGKASDNAAPCEGGGEGLTLRGAECKGVEVLDEMEKERKGVRVINYRRERFNW